jgi:signal transduction histidine kinase
LFRKRDAAVKNCVFVQTDLADDLPLIEGDQVQLQQVMLNLIVNGIRAMSDVAEGQRDLLISTEFATKIDTLSSLDTTAIRFPSGLKAANLGSVSKFSTRP